MSDFYNFIISTVFQRNVIRDRIQQSILKSVALSHLIGGNNFWAMLQNGQKH